MCVKKNFKLLNIYIQYDLLLTVSVNILHWLSLVRLTRFCNLNKMTDSIAIDDDIISVWNKFPKSIRDDPCFSAFRKEFEGANGNLLDRYLLIVLNLPLKLSHLLRSRSIYSTK